MHWVNRRGLNCLQFPALANLPDFIHGVFLRQANDAQGWTNWFELGLGHGVPDAKIWKNRKKVLDFFGTDYSGVYAHQVHGTDVGVLHARSCRKLPGNSDPIQLNGDALITDAKGAALVIQVADCQSVMIIDPVRGAVANIHSGWRGSIQNIIGAAIHRMELEFQCRPENFVCGIGPSLGPCCAEFVNFRDEIPEAFWGYRRSGHRFDFWQASIDQLKETGVRPNNINLSGMCTKCNQHLFFSYRGERLTGRFVAVAGIRSSLGSGT